MIASHLEMAMVKSIGNSCEIMTGSDMFADGHPDSSGQMEQSNEKGA